MSASSPPLTTAIKTVGILIYPDAEVLDFCGPFEVFATTRLNEESRRESESPIRQFLVSESKEVVVTSGGMRVLPDVDFASCPKLNVLLVPGGHGVRALMHQPEPALKWLQVTAEEGFPNYPLFEGDANLDNLRKDPGFVSFMEKLKQQWEGYQATL